MARSANTAKQKVLKKCPQAHAKEGLLSGTWYVYSVPQRDGRHVIGHGETALQAWRDAASKL